MLLAYVDGSGNTGHPNLRGSLMYSLGCVLVEAQDWSASFEAALALRRRLRDSYGLPIRTEIKAQYLIRGNGPLRKLQLPPRVRGLIYRAHMDALESMSVRAFAVAVDKRRLSEDACPGCFDTAWEGLLQRLERSTRDNNQPFMVIHDEGEDDAVRRWVRRSRRLLTAGSAFGQGSMGNRPVASRLVDDPVPRCSERSYFIQLADLVAYAAFRYEIPPSDPVSVICPKEMWSAIGGATFKEVSGLRTRSAPGIVLR
jgi:hypothetical protein